MTLVLLICEEALRSLVVALVRSPTSGSAQVALGHSDRRTLSIPDLDPTTFGALAEAKHAIVDSLE